MAPVHPLSHIAFRPRSTLARKGQTRKAFQDRALAPRLISNDDQLRQINQVASVACKDVWHLSSISYLFWFYEEDRGNAIERHNAARTRVAADRATWKAKQYTLAPLATRAGYRAAGTDFVPLDRSSKSTFELGMTQAASLHMQPCPQARDVRGGCLAKRWGFKSKRLAKQATIKDFIFLIIRTGADGERQRSCK